MYIDERSNSNEKNKESRRSEQVIARDQQQVSPSPTPHISLSPFLAPSVLQTRPMAIKREKNEEMDIWEITVDVTNMAPLTLRLRPDMITSKLVKVSTDFFPPSFSLPLPPSSPPSLPPLLPRFLLSSYRPSFSLPSGLHGAPRGGRERCSMAEPRRTTSGPREDGGREWSGGRR